MDFEIEQLKVGMPTKHPGKSSHGICSELLCRPRAEAVQMLQISFMDLLIKQWNHHFNKTLVDYSAQYWLLVSITLKSKTPSNNKSITKTQSFSCGSLLQQSGYSFLFYSGLWKQEKRYKVNSQLKSELTIESHQENWLHTSESSGGEYYFFAPESKLLMRQETWNVDLLQLHHEGERSKTRVWEETCVWGPYLNISHLSQLLGNKPSHFFT